LGRPRRLRSGSEISYGTERGGGARGRSTVARAPPPFARVKTRTMAWYHKVPAPKLPATDKRTRLEGLWIKCDGCGEIIYKQEVERNLEVCPKCGEHFPLPVRRRLDLVLDPGSFVEYDRGLESTDPLGFSDAKKYKDRLKASAKTAGEE